MHVSHGDGARKPVRTCLSTPKRTHSCLQNPADNHKLPTIAEVYMSVCVRELVKWQANR